MQLQGERTVAGVRVLLPSVKKEQLATNPQHWSREWRALKSYHRWCCRGLRCKQRNRRMKVRCFSKRSSNRTPEIEARSIRGYSTRMIILDYGRRRYVSEVTRLLPTPTPPLRSSLRYYKIIDSFNNYDTILSKLSGEDINFEPDNNSEFLSNTTFEVCINWL
ncbi:hypothetical protein Ahy_A06g028550 [Arachis hypogaea]|uniref:Uncharacterized protein n=1 Tax=Arachis hypogaea TaxID=3818 RepID=A0A445CR63_ARAHY|nr:hypothetical protein Ahy_A06g028550 [Arachis hypogaea]